MTFKHYAIAGLAAVTMLSAQAASTDDDEKPLFKDAKGNELASRQLVGKGSTIEVFYNPCKIRGRIEFKETKRNSKIHEDLLAVAAKIGEVDPNQDGSNCVDVSQKYVTKHKRSTLVVRGIDADEKLVGEKTIVVGPAESLFLSLDLPVTNRKTLRYDDKANQLLPKDKSPFLYLGLNLSPGDVLTDPQDVRSSWKDKISLKLMVEASSHPLDSYGVGVGYRLGDIGAVDLEGLSIFAGYFRSKSDVVDNGVVKAEQGRTSSWRVGLSYSLGAALKWVKL